MPVCINCNENVDKLCGKSEKFCSRKCASQFAAKQPRSKPDEDLKNKRAVAIKKSHEKFIGVKTRCKICDIEFTIRGLPSHIWRRHGEGINHAPDLRKSFENGRTSWNKGLDKNTSDIVKNISEKVSITMKNKVINGTYVQRKMSDANKKKLSIRQSLHNTGGKCKWFAVANQKVQGTWEKNLAEQFETFQIVWEKLKTNKDIYTYILGDKEKSYTPDFYLKEFDTFIEVKGYWWGNDKEKMEKVIKTYPSLKEKMIIIEKEKYKDLLSKLSKEEFLMALWQ